MFIIFNVMENIKADKKAANTAAYEGESVSLVEPMLVSGGSRHRAALTDLAIELAAKSAGLRRSLPEGVLNALADLVRGDGLLLQQSDRRPQYTSGRYRASTEEGLQRRSREAEPPD